MGIQKWFLPAWTWSTFLITQIGMAAPAYNPPPPTRTISSPPAQSTGRLKYLSTITNLSPCTLCGALLCDIMCALLSVSRKTETLNYTIIYLTVSMHSEERQNGWPGSLAIAQKHFRKPSNWKLSASFPVVLIWSEKYMNRLVHVALAVNTAHSSCQSYDQLYVTPQRILGRSQHCHGLGWIHHTRGLIRGF